MSFCKLGLTFAALTLFLVWEPHAVHAAGAPMFATHADASMRAGAARIGLPAFHSHRKQSFYCYPKNYWWFYRPYTTALDGHARCMPYFHYLGPDGRRGARPDRYIK